jgi:hypothetical protein
MKERRLSRSPVSLFVGLGEPGEPPGRTRNISLGGVFLETKKRPELTTLVDLWFVWGEETFVGKARVVHHADDGIGVAFVDPEADFLKALAEILGLDQST